MGMSLARVAWLVVVCICLVAALLLALWSYTGYAFLSIAVGASAAINLR